MSFCSSGGHSEWLNCGTLSQGPGKFECILIWSPCLWEKFVWWGTKPLVDLNKIKCVQNTYVEQYYKCSFGSSRESKADQILACRCWVCLSLTNLWALKLWIDKTKTSEMNRHPADSLKCDMTVYSHGWLQPSICFHIWNEVLLFVHSLDEKKQNVNSWNCQSNVRRRPLTDSDKHHAKYSSQLTPK